jgi:hypothetical protein
LPSTTTSSPWQETPFWVRAAWIGGTQPELTGRRLPHLTHGV